MFWDTVCLFVKLHRHPAMACIKWNKSIITYLKWVSLYDKGVGLQCQNNGMALLKTSAMGKYFSYTGDNKPYLASAPATATFSWEQPTLLSSQCPTEKPFRPMLNFRIKSINEDHKGKCLVH